MDKLPSFSWCFDRRGTLATTGVASVEMRVSYMRRCKVMATGVRLGRGEWRDGRIVGNVGRLGRNTLSYCYGPLWPCWRSMGGGFLCSLT